MNDTQKMLLEKFISDSMNNGTDDWLIVLDTEKSNAKIAEISQGQIIENEAKIEVLQSQIDSLNGV
jgi:hypothetical protein